MPTYRPTPQDAQTLAYTLYGLSASATPLHGELDFNFRLQTEQGKFILKISRPNPDIKYLDFQLGMLEHLAQTALQLPLQACVPNRDEQMFAIWHDPQGEARSVRLHLWQEGRIWSALNPITEDLLEDLGQMAGRITKGLEGYSHAFAEREMRWDPAQIGWTAEHVDLFQGDEKSLIQHFHARFQSLPQKLAELRKGVIHMDVNDNNILVSTDPFSPKVEAIIDYGDATFTYQICDAAVALAYGAMEQPDPLGAACALLKGYHAGFPLEEAEFAVLYDLTAARLVITLTQAQLNLIREPENPYHQISVRQAWDLLKKWRDISPDLAHYAFRATCNFPAHPKSEAFTNWAQSNPLSVVDLFPTMAPNGIEPVDMSVRSAWLGMKDDYEQEPLTWFKISELIRTNPTKIVAGGYGEVRPFYSTQAYESESNHGPVYRTVHLGIDFWTEALTPLHALWGGTVYSLADNAGRKNYGPTLILQHQTPDGTPYWSLYGHLSRSTLELFQPGDTVQKGDLIGYLGVYEENGDWVPHLHFQLMLDMLGNEQDFYGVGLPHQRDIWLNICPDPNLFFQEKELEPKSYVPESQMFIRRKTDLGRSLSLSYDQPLHMVRGDGAYLIDHTGRRYLDTVNNVAHVGHEHPAVVRAGQGQMAILNTNTRYLHDEILAFAEELLATFPPELSVVHFVNSGSEANDLAYRMTQAYTGQQDYIVVEGAYHGHTHSVLGLSPYKFDGKGGKGAPDSTHVVPMPDVFRGKHRGENTGQIYAQYVEQAIQEMSAKGRKPAAFFCESILSCGGQIELPKGYLPAAYEAVRKVGGLCVSDEVQVGCGRVGSAFWGFELQGVVPDIVTIGKPIGNGHPLAAVVCTAEVADAFANGMEYFNTFGGNPVSSAIGRAVLRVIQGEGLQQHAWEIGKFLKNGLTELQKDFPIIGDVRGQGLFLGFELNGKNLQPLAKQAHYLAQRMRKLGILMSTDGPDHNVLKIKPPMVFSQENAEELLGRLGTVLKEDAMQVLLS